MTRAGSSLQSTRRSSTLSLHGNKNAADKQVDVRFVTEQDAVTVYVRDTGEGFDPSQLPDPTSSDNLLNPSGRGIFYMRTFMDEVEHSIHPEGGSVVRLTKNQAIILN